MLEFVIGGTFVWWSGTLVIYVLLFNNPGIGVHGCRSRKIQDGPTTETRSLGVTRHPGILEWDWPSWVEAGIFPSMQAIETTGVVDDQEQLRLDTPLPIRGASRVRVIMLWPEPAELDEADWLRTASVNPAFDFLKEETESLYTVHDGKHFPDWFAGAELIF